MEAFNKLVAEKVMAEYRRAMARLELPVTDALLESTHSKAAELAGQLFESERFGGDAEEAVRPLETALKQVNA